MSIRGYPTNFFQLESSMLQSKFEDHLTSGSEEEDLFHGFYHILSWRASRSCDLDYLYNLDFIFRQKSKWLNYICNLPTVLGLTDTIYQSSASLNCLTFRWITCKAFLCCMVSFTNVIHVIRKSTFNRKQRRISAAPLRRLDSTDIFAP